MLREKPPPGRDGGFSEMSSAGCLDNSEIIKPPRPNTQIKFQTPDEAEFDVEIALALTASGWRVAACLLTHAALLIDAGDFQSAERNRRQAREQFVAANDIFRQVQESMAAEGAGLWAEAFA